MGGRPKGGPRGWNPHAHREREMKNPTRFLMYGYYADAVFARL